MIQSALLITWKTARVAPIPKDQILSSVQSLISPCQYAFRRGHNTTSVLLKLTDTIRYDRGFLTSLVALGLSKAFNSINDLVLIIKLGRLFGFSRCACGLIHSYLTGRSQFVDVNGFFRDFVLYTLACPKVLY